MPGMMFPKPEKKKHLSGSIIPGNQKDICYICGKYCRTENHHIFFGKGNRDLSDQYGLTVFLCIYCHKESKEAVHRNKDTRRMLERLGQKEFERQIGPREEFIQIFGSNYL